MTERSVDGARLVMGTPEPEDRQYDAALRPRRLVDYVGQEKVKEPLSIFIAAANERSEPLDHVLLHGPPGLGKTTLAHIIAVELQTTIRITSGPAIERPGDLAAILTNLEPGGVLFIDEIHRLNRTVEEILYPAMEDYALDIIIGKGPAARSLRLNLPRFTLIGATTRAGLLTSPLRDRFGVICRLEFYRVQDLVEIIRRSASLLDVRIDEGGTTQIASRSRGTPRVANRLLRRLRDYAQVRADGIIIDQVASDGLAMLEVDELGLDRLDRMLLSMIADKFDGGPVGLDTLAAALGEESQTLEDVYEPYLLQIGFLNRTPRGRTLTRPALEYLGRRTGDDQGRLF